MANGGYIEGTKILTYDGWKDLSAVDKSDKFAVKNNDGFLEYLNPSAIMTEQFRGEILQFENTEMSLAVTPEHKMWVFDYSKRSPKTRIWKVSKAEEMTNKQYLFDRGADWLGKVEKVITIPSVTVPAGFTEKRFGGLDFEIEPFMELLGLWVTDGCISPARNGSGRRLAISQTKERVRVRIKELLAILNLKYSECGPEFRINCIPLWVKLKEWFIEGENYRKSLYVTNPAWIKDLDSKHLHAFVRGLFLGDGFEDKSRSLIYSSSESFCEDLLELSLKTGYAGSIREYRKEGHIRNWGDGRISICHSSYVVNFKKGVKLLLDKRRIENKLGERVQYVGNIYNVLFPQYQRIYVMRNGGPVWCGSL